MGLPDSILQRVAQILSVSAETRVSIIQSEPAASGWSAQFGSFPWVTRCTIKAETGGVSASVIVKVRRPAEHLRNGLDLFSSEQAALKFLPLVGSDAGPRLLAADNDAGILVMEDLGAGPSLEDLLVGKGASVAEHGLMMFATALGQMHAVTAGHAQEYYQIKSTYGSVDPVFDRISILGISIKHAWRQVQEIIASRSYLPSPTSDVGQDVEEILHILSEPGSYLAFSNGDTCPANCRLLDDTFRFLDFEHACFRHALLDGAALRFPFPACPCWSHLPVDIGQRAEDTYKKQLASSIPDVLDPVSYNHGLTAACAAWTIVRMVRLPKLETKDESHPMGFSRRGQLLDTITTTVNCSQQSRSLRSFASWLASVSDALHVCWPHLLSIQPFYPAFY